MPSKPIRILGLDPGLRHTGWGVIISEGQSLSYCESGVITPPSKDVTLDARLSYLFVALRDVIQRLNPCEAAIEEIFVNQNPASTLKLGMARGVILMTPSYLGVPVTSYAANMVKKSVVGVGHADKNQVSTMVRRILPLTPANLLVDASDALAVAICHAHHRALKQRIYG